ncbi:MAG: 50S ribosomal protein L9 [Candidatus Abawacabacteria bacterium RBG_16_42_10]|uniref:Large ribosomal subunit protein bL9 n=1 Tax=Candidatus Abawacabacteria bacterium RBG_16_42_10 TaxID=1817814 RepID=A0A1F4XND1_9BACT|nr:MAG: 50S ribosomal protein L9 [Candidatus Abawacabacteria bacterium RBG_16_42_10]
MKLVLTQDVQHVGKKHDVVVVKRGHGRNFLLPRGLATIATPGLLAQAQIIQTKKEERKQKMTAKAKELAQKIKDLELVFEAKVTKKGPLFGSISRHDVMMKLAKEIEFKIDPDALILEAPIKTLGKHRIKVQLSSEVEAILHLVVKKQA